MMIMQDTCWARELLHLFLLYVLISGDQTQLPTGQKPSLCWVCECRRPAGKHIKFLISRGSKFDTAEWNSFECSCILHFTEYFWRQRYFRLYFVVQPHHFLCRIRHVDPLCVFISSLPTTPSFMCWFWAKRDWEKNCTLWRLFVGGLGWNDKRGLFIWRKFMHCKAYSKVHA